MKIYIYMHAERKHTHSYCGSKKSVVVWVVDVEVFGSLIAV